MGKLRGQINTTVIKFDVFSNVQIRFDSFIFFFPQINYFLYVIWYIVCLFLFWAFFSLAWHSPKNPNKEVLADQNWKSIFKKPRGFWRQMVIPQADDSADVAISVLFFTYDSSLQKIRIKKWSSLRPDIYFGLNAEGGYFRYPEIKFTSRMGAKHGDLNSWGIAFGTKRKKGRFFLGWVDKQG